MADLIVPTPTNVNPGIAGSQGSAAKASVSTHTNTVLQEFTQGLLGNNWFDEVEYKPGHLGQEYRSVDYQVALAKSYRYSSTHPFTYSQNHRFRGHREAFKFLLPMQDVMRFGSLQFQVLHPRYKALGAYETTQGLSDTELALMCHVITQTRYRQYLTLRNDSLSWFI